MSEEPKELTTEEKDRMNKEIDKLFKSTDWGVFDRIFIALMCSLFLAFLVLVFIAECQ